MRVTAECEGNAQGMCFVSAGVYWKSVDEAHTGVQFVALHKNDQLPECINSMTNEELSNAVDRKRRHAIQPLSVYSFLG